MSMLDLAGPQAPQGRDFCVHCLLEYKARIIYHHRAAIKVIQEDGQPDNWVPWDMRKHEEGVENLVRPRLAAGLGWVSGNESWGMVPVCWVHMTYVPAIIGVTVAPSGIAVARGDVEQVVAQMGGQGLALGSKGQRG